MSERTWTAPETGTYHFISGADPHPIAQCGKWCLYSGWAEWVAESVVIDPDVDPLLVRRRLDVPSEGAVST